MNWQLMTFLSEREKNVYNNAKTHYKRLADSLEMNRKRIQESIDYAASVGTPRQRQISRDFIEATNGLINNIGLYMERYLDEMMHLEDLALERRNIIYGTTPSPSPSLRPTTQPPTPAPLEPPTPAAFGVCYVGAPFGGDAGDDSYYYNEYINDNTIYKD
jgi:hypothetical protein